MMDFGWPRYLNFHQNTACIKAWREKGSKGKMGPEPELYIQKSLCLNNREVLDLSNHSIKTMIHELTRNALQSF